MSESERALFQHLREWRSKQAREEGLPSYLILTNRQLVTLVRRRPESATAVGHIDGIGPGKVERYAQAILRLLHGTPLASGDGATSQSAVAVEIREGEASATVAAEQVHS
jgi:ribonuclease D